MTTIAKKALRELKHELEHMPEHEQEAWATRLLAEVKNRKGRGEEEDVEPYSSLQVLLEADLDLPADFSVTYERELYGRVTDLDD